MSMITVPLDAACVHPPPTSLSSSPARVVRSEECDVALGKAADPENSVYDDGFVPNEPIVPADGSRSAAAPASEDEAGAVAASTMLSKEDSVLFDVVTYIQSRRQCPTTVHELTEEFLWAWQYEPLCGPLVHYLAQHRDVFHVSDHEEDGEQYVRVRRFGAEPPPSVGTGGGGGKVRRMRAPRASKTRGMVCSACVAERIDLIQLQRMYKRLDYTTTLCNGILHVTNVSATNYGTYHRQFSISDFRERFDLFVYSFGAFVWWGTDINQYYTVEKDYLLHQKSVAYATFTRPYPMHVVSNLFPIWGTYEITSYAPASAGANSNASTAASTAASLCSHQHHSPSSGPAPDYRRDGGHATSVHHYTSTPPPSPPEKKSSFKGVVGVGVKVNPSTQTTNDNDFKVAFKEDAHEALSPTKSNGATRRGDVSSYLHTPSLATSSGATGNKDFTAHASVPCSAATVHVHSPPAKCSAADASPTGGSNAFLASKRFQQALFQDHYMLEGEGVGYKQTVAHVLAQSAMLDVLEDRIAEELTLTCSSLPIELRDSGCSSLSDTQVACFRGKASLYRLHLLGDEASFTGTPEFLWEHPWFDDLYKTLQHHYSIAMRVTFLDGKLTAAQEILDTLADDLTVKHELRLEWIIIILIASEVVLALIELALDYMFGMWV